jgi:hypothetical protein
VCWKMGYTLHLQRQGKPFKNRARENTEVVVGEDVTECQCCFIEGPLHQMVQCEGEVAHVRLPFPKLFRAFASLTLI